jgi:glycosyltransferase involved in cell wall biosynthesis
MASGLPVVATKVGGNAELVTDDVTGVLVPAQNVESLAQALVRMAGDRQQARLLGQAGRREVEQRFSLEAMVSAYQLLYEGELSKRRRTTRN